VADYDAFADYLDWFQVKQAVPDLGSYLRRGKNGLDRLRQVLCRAWRERKAGFTTPDATTLTADEFAKRLQRCGIECTKASVENAVKRPFEPHSCPDTPVVVQALTSVQRMFRTVDLDLILYKVYSTAAVSIRRQDGGDASGGSEQAGIVLPAAPDGPLITTISNPYDGSYTSTSEPLSPSA
jgi:hypothetical protein